MVTVTESAQEYLAGLLAKQDVDGMAVRMFVAQPGTRNAETCLAYCRPDEVKIEDENILRNTHRVSRCSQSAVPGGCCGGL